MKCYNIYFAPGGDRGTGGLLTLIHNDLLQDVASVRTDIPVAGRFMRFNILYSNGSMVNIWNAHNYGLDGTQTLTVISLIKEDVAAAESHPDLVFTCMAGDFNLNPT
eukprot:12429511-Karenia_brevis.AAC.1